MPRADFSNDAPRVTELRCNLDDADPATLLMVLVQITGEREWLERAAPFIQGPMSYQERMPPELRSAIRDRLAEVLTDEAPVRAIIDDDLLVEMMSVAAGERVANDYIPMMREDRAARRCVRELQRRSRSAARRHGLDSQGHDQLVSQQSGAGLRRLAMAAGRLLEDDGAARSDLDGVDNATQRRFLFFNNSYAQQESVVLS